jgi:hypothetical protein
MIKTLFFNVCPSGFLESQKIPPDNLDTEGIETETHNVFPGCTVKSL